MKTILAVLVGLSLATMASAQVVVPYSNNVQMPTFIVGGSSTNSVTVNGIAVTSTDGFTLQNTTASTGGVTVQMSPRLTWIGTAWDTAASETVAFFAETLPATAATPTGTWKLGYSLNGAAATYPLTVSSGGLVTALAGVTSGANVQAQAANHFVFNGRTRLESAADGNFSVANNADAIGARLKVDALPVASSCGAGSPAVVAGSTPLSGSVTVGTGGPLTCTITFGGTAYPSAPHCNGAVETTTAANARAMGYSASATVLTIVPSAAWADSSVVNWDCFSSK